MKTLKEENHADSIDSMTRDFTTVHPKTKSEVRRRLMELRDISYREGQKSEDAHVLCRKHEIEDITKAKARLLKELEKEVIEMQNKTQLSSPDYDYALDKVLSLIKQKSL